MEVSDGYSTTASIAGLTFSSNVSVARTVSALERVMLIEVEYTNTMGC